MARGRTEWKAARRDFRTRKPVFWLRTLVCPAFPIDEDQWRVGQVFGPTQRRVRVGMAGRPASPTSLRPGCSPERAFCHLQADIDANGQRRGCKCGRIYRIGVLRPSNVLRMSLALPQLEIGRSSGNGVSRWLAGMTQLFVDAERRTASGCGIREPPAVALKSLDCWRLAGPAIRTRTGADETAIQRPSNTGSARRTT